MNKRVIIVVASVLFLAQGCGQKEDSITNSVNNPIDPANPPTEVVRLLDNYSAGDEFDIAEIMTAPEGSDDYINDSIYDAYIVTFLWGKLTNDASMPNLPTVWDGSLWINGPSEVRLLHTIDFEEGEDSIVVEDHPWGEQWGSSTDEDFDGAVFLLLYDKVTPTFAQQLLTFETDPITLQFDFYQLIHFYAFYRVDQVNSVAVYAHKIRPTHCREGYFEGDWEKSGHAEGNFRGLWHGHNGDTIGTVYGRYWQTEDGHRLMEGVINGVFLTVVLGHLQGVWEYDDARMCPICGEGHGNFKGRFQMDNSDVNGYFRGEFGDYSLPPDDSVMPFYGKWKMNCVDLVEGDFSNTD
jgi:hypothetical protein